MRPDRIPFAGCLRQAPSALRPGDLVLVGLADDSRSSFRRGAAAAPSAIRQGYDGRCFNSTTESGVDLARQIIDLGDWDGADWETARRSFRVGAERLLRSDAVPFFLGGDHAVTVPIVAGLGSAGREVHVIQIDAHPDLYPEYDGDLWSHACTAARLLEMRHVRTLTQIGVRTMNEVQQRQASRHGDRLQIFEAADCLGGLPLPDHIGSGEEVYLSLDIDSLDPGFAPGVSHPVPGGLTPRQLLDWLRHFPWRLSGMDLVEVNPSLDPAGLTCALAGRLLHEAMGVGYAQRKSRK